MIEMRRAQLSFGDGLIAEEAGRSARNYEARRCGAGG